MQSKETDALLGDGSRVNASSRSSSLRQQSTNGNPGDGFGGGGLHRKSYSVSPDGSISYLTPLEMGRHELYEILPYSAIMGMQKKMRNLKKAFADFAADLDVAEAEMEAKMKHTSLSEEDKKKRRTKSSQLLQDDMTTDESVVTTPLIFAVLFASMAQFLNGYNLGVMNAPENVVFVGHSLTSWSLAVAAFAAGGPFGAVVAGTLADTRGRRGALLIDVWIFLAGGIIQTCALNMIMITLARFIIGFASGFSSVLVPIYLGEVAPPSLRGTMGTLTQFAQVIGTLVSYLLGFVFATVELWRILFAVTAIISIGLLCCSPLLLESPRWLLGRDPSSKTARENIKKLRGIRYDYEVETEIKHHLSASRAQQFESGDEKGKHKGTVIDLLRDKNVRLLMISCLVLQMGQQLSGINAVFYYSGMFFEGVISNPLTGTTIVGAVNVVATYVALLLMDSTGRRTLILWSAGGMFVNCIGIVLSLLGYFPNMVALACVNLYVTFFEIGLGPVPWLIVGEMFDAKYVSVAMSACSQLNWICNFIVGLVFPSMNKCLGPYSFAPFGIVLLFTFIFTLLYLPETQGTTPAELQAMLAKKNSTTKYHGMDIERSHSNPINEEWQTALHKLMGGDEKTTIVDKGSSEAK